MNRFIGQEHDIEWEISGVDPLENPYVSIVLYLDEITPKVLPNVLASEVTSTRSFYSSVRSCAS